MISMGFAHITITWELEEPDSPNADALCPYLAVSHFRNVEARGVNADGAIGAVKGIILHCLAEWRDPPDQIIFTVLHKESP